jgi:rhodanese-related sulfurtransferase
MTGVAFLGPASGYDERCEMAEAREGEMAEAGQDQGERAEVGEAETVKGDEARRLVAAGEVMVLDLRDDEGWMAGHIPGATHAAEGEVEDHLEGVPEDRRILVVCEDGERSAEAAGRMRDQGRDALSIDGGMKAWGDRLQPSSDPD